MANDTAKPTLHQSPLFQVLYVAGFAIAPQFANLVLRRRGVGMPARAVLVGGVAAALVVALIVAFRRASTTNTRSPLRLVTVAALGAALAALGSAWIDTLI